MGRAKTLMADAFGQDLVHDNHFSRFFHASDLCCVLHCMHFSFIPMPDALSLVPSSSLFNGMVDLHFVNADFESPLNAYFA